VEVLGQLSLGESAERHLWKVKTLLLNMKTFSFLDDQIINVPLFLIKMLLQPNVKMINAGLVKIKHEKT